jgi:hypothetical protein
MVTHVPHTTTIVDAWIHVLSLLEEGGQLDLTRLDILFTPTLAVTPTAARGKRSGHLKV